MHQRQNHLESNYVLQFMSMFIIKQNIRQGTQQRGCTVFALECTQDGGWSTSRFQWMQYTSNAFALAHRTARITLLLRYPARRHWRSVDITMGSGSHAVNKQTADLHCRKLLSKWAIEFPHRNATQLHCHKYRNHQQREHHLHETIGTLGARLVCRRQKLPLLDSELMYRPVKLYVWHL
jgi:hypothetical protein